MTNHNESRKTYSQGPQTPRLEHRRLNAGDAEAFYALNSHPDVMRYTGEEPLRSAQDAAQAIAAYPDFETVGYGRWGCILKETQKLIGFCGLKYLDDLDAVDVGYRFFPEYWGQGLATEACRASVSFGFSTLHLEQIIALVLPENLASIRVLEKVGMSRRAEMIENGVEILRYEISRP